MKSLQLAQADVSSPAKPPAPGPRSPFRRCAGRVSRTTEAAGAAAVPAWLTNTQMPGTCRRRYSASPACPPANTQASGAGASGEGEAASNKHLVCMLCCAPSASALAACSNDSRKRSSVLTDTPSCAARSCRTVMWSFCAMVYASVQSTETSAPVRFDGHKLATLSRSCWPLVAPPASGDSSKSNLRVMALSRGSLSFAMPR
mmetsp:Transcript_104182/g.311113  ORF Transcript_104182/g.311113 Transcript_104182/m.311113 type:complete len:202 (-) Transcript_104182:861-1466(-)